MTKKQVHLLSIFSIFFFALTILVSCGAERNLKRGEKYLALGEYFDAANEFKQAYQKTPPKERERRGQIALKMALCYDKTLQTGKAVAAYRNVIRYKQDKIEEHLALARQREVMSLLKQSSSLYWILCPTIRWQRRALSLQKTRPVLKKKVADTT